jgi:toxin ParE1/3/4
MKALLVAREAEADLDEIWSFIDSRERSPQRADSVINELAQHFVVIASAPSIGRRQDHIEPGMRSLPVGNYLVYYRETGEHVLIMRVVHAARSTRKVFGVD